MTPVVTIKKTPKRPEYTNAKLDIPLISKELVDYIKGYFAPKKYKRAELPQYRDIDIDIGNQEVIEYLEQLYSKQTVES